MKSVGEGFSKIDKGSVPRHVAFIPDGNRRWARKNKIMPEEGHKIGAKILLDVIRAGKELGIEVLTFYVFSTENWRRPKREIRAQMRLLKRMLLEQRDYMLENGVGFLTIGNLSPFPADVVKVVEDTVKATKNCGNIKVVFAINYGGRDELARAFRRMIADYDGRAFEKEDIGEDLVAGYLDTVDLPDPDLLIRTSGESRLSNFLLWQISYAELAFLPIYWPEFTSEHLAQVIFDYQRREKRRGK